MSLDAYGGVMVDAQCGLSVQSLLDLQGTDTELMSQPAFIQGPPTEITLDEDDVFQCGKCKKVFTSFQMFMFHKKEHQLSPGGEYLDGGMSLSLDGDLDEDLDGSGLVDQEICMHNSSDQQLSSEQCASQGVQQVSSVLQYATLDDTAFDGLSSDIRQPMMLEDSDALNFSMEPSVLDLTCPNQLPQGTYIPSSMASLDSSTIAQTMNEDTSSNTAWLLANKDTDSNLNLVTSNYSEDRALYLGTKRFLVDGGKSITPSLEFSNDDLLQDVPYSSSKEMFLNDSSLAVSEVMSNDSESRNILQAGEYILKNGIDYINSNDLLTELENVRQQGMVNDQAGSSVSRVSVSVLEVDIPNLTENEIHSSVMETQVMEGRLIESSMIETSMIETPIMGTQILETPIMEAPMMETSMMENSMIDSHMMENHIMDNHMLGNRLINDSMIEDSMNQERMIEDVLLNGAIMESSMMESPMMDSHGLEAPVIESLEAPVLHSLEAPVIHTLEASGIQTLEAPVVQTLETPVIETPVIEAPVIEVEAPIMDGSPESPQSDPDEPQTQKRTFNLEDYGLKEVIWEPRALKLKCQFCNKKFAKQFDLRQHQRSHTGEKPFQCIVCGRAFAQKSNVKKHMETHKVWPKSVLTLPKNILQKVETKTKETVHESVIKVHSSKTADNISDKDLSEDEDDSSKEEVQYIIDNSYICQFCDASFESYFELKTHLKTHTNEKVYMCNQTGCKKTFPDLRSFVSHTQIHCSQEATYRCHVCQETFKTLADLGIHQYSHTSLDKASLKRSGTRVVCPECRSRFVSVEALETHMLMATHNHPCPECQRIFSCERNLRRHLNTHSTACPFICKECGKGFKTETYLNAHLAMHSKDRPFACEQCTATFTRKDRLSRHLLIHEDGKRLKCPFSTHLNCTKTFSRKDKLKMHILSHTTGKKSFSCQYCKKEFKKAVLLRKHEIKCAEENQIENFPHIKINKKKPLRVQIPKTKSKSENAHQSPEVSKSVVCKFTPKPRKSQKKRRLPEISPESSQDGRGSDTNSENVPTIEIIVMPLNLNMRPDIGENSDKVKVSGDSGVYRVMISGDGSEYPLNLTTDCESLLSRVDCDKEGGINLLSADQEVAVYSAPADMQ